MTLEKAIELNKESIASLKGSKFQDHAEAVIIANEALSRLRTLRAEPHLQAAALLPSETEF